MWHTRLTNKEQSRWCAHSTWSAHTYNHWVSCIHYQTIVYGFLYSRQLLSEVWLHDYGSNHNCLISLNIDSLQCDSVRKFLERTDLWKLKVENQMNKNVSNVRKNEWHCGSLALFTVVKLFIWRWIPMQLPKFYYRAHILINLHVSQFCSHTQFLPQTPIEGLVFHLAGKWCYVLVENETLELCVNRNREILHCAFHIASAVMMKQWFCMQCNLMIVFNNFSLFNFYISFQLLQYVIQSKINLP